MSIATIIRDTIQNTNGKFVSISFVKKDGSIRTLTHRENMLNKYVKQDAESQAKAAARRANNPHLITVIDMHAHAKLPEDQKARAIRSIDVNRVFEIKANGRTIPFGRVVSHVVPLGQ